MTNRLFILLLLIAAFFLFLGAFHLFHDNVFQPTAITPDYITSFFSLSGVLLFCAALMYQIKEYRLQVEELKKSVVAQAKTSIESERQTALMQEQNSQILIHNMIETFIRFKQNEELQIAVKSFYKTYGTFFKGALEPIIRNSDAEEFPRQVSLTIKQVLIQRLRQDNDFHRIRRFVQFSYNTLFFLDQMKTENRKDWFTPLTYSLLSREESLLIHLANLVDFDVPFYGNIHWRIEVTRELIQMINHEGLSENKINIGRLIDELNSMKQKL